MSSSDFIAELNALDIYLLISLQLLFFFLQYNYVKNRQTGIIDPFTIPLFFLSSGWAVVVFLFLNGYCSIDNFVAFLITNVTFFLCYMLITTRSSPSDFLPMAYIESHSLKRFHVFGIICVSAYLVVDFINYVIFGFGISAENRLQIYTETGGFGLLFRVKDALVVPAIFYLVYIRLTRNNAIRKLAVLILIVMSFSVVLDGSKSGLVAIATIYVTTIIWFSKRKITKPLQVNWFWLLIFFTMVLIFAAGILALKLNALENPEMFGEAVTVLLYRIVVASDIFVVAYPNDKLNLVHPDYSPLLVLFNDIFNTLRILKLDITPLGTKLYNINSRSIEVLAGGPNSHHSVFGQYLFGNIGAPFFSGILGFLFGLIRRYFETNKGAGLINGALITTLLIQSAYIANDPSHTLHHITNFILILMPIALICKIKQR